MFLEVLIFIGVYAIVLLHVAVALKLRHYLQRVDAYQQRLDAIMQDMVWIKQTYGRISSVYASFQERSVNKGPSLPSSSSSLSSSSSSSPSPPVSTSVPDPVSSSSSPAPVSDSSPSLEEMGAGAALKSFFWNTALPRLAQLRHS